MAIVQTIDSAYELEQAFKAYGREDNFSSKGLRKLFDYLEGYSDSTGEDYHLDVIALCCDYTEYTCIEDFIALQDPCDFDHEEFNEQDDDGKLEMIRNYLEYRTTAVCCDDGCILFHCF